MPESNSGESRLRHQENFDAAFDHLRKMGIALATVLLVTLTAARQQVGWLGESLKQLQEIKDILYEQAGIDSKIRSTGLTPPKGFLSGIERSLDADVQIEDPRGELMSGVEKISEIELGYNSHNRARLCLQRMWMFPYRDYRDALKEKLMFGLPFPSDPGISPRGVPTLHTFVLYWDEFGRSLLHVPDSVLHRGNIICKNGTFTYRSLQIVGSESRDTTPLYDLVPEVLSGQRFRFDLKVDSERQQGSTQTTQTALEGCVTDPFTANEEHKDGISPERLQALIREVIRDDIHDTAGIPDADFSTAFHALDEATNTHLLKNADIEDLWTYLRSRASEPSGDIAFLGFRLQITQAALLVPLLVILLQIYLQAALRALLRNKIELQDDCDHSIGFVSFIEDPLLSLAGLVLFVILPPIAILTLLTAAVIPTHGITIISSLDAIFEALRIGGWGSDVKLISFTLASAAISWHSFSLYRKVLSVDSVGSTEVLQLSLAAQIRAEKGNGK